VISFAVFLIVKAINKLKRDETPLPPPQPVVSNEEKLLTEIRDLLRNGK
jgi:large conductance mechanosensitive channel